jgi:hypothetical protein
MAIVSPSQTSTTTTDNMSYSWTPKNFVKSGLGNPDPRPWYRELLFNDTRVEGCRDVEHQGPSHVALVLYHTIGHLADRRNTAHLNTESNTASRHVI